MLADVVYWSEGAPASDRSARESTIDARLLILWILAGCRVRFVRQALARTALWSDAHYDTHGDCWRRSRWTGGWHRAGSPESALRAEVFEVSLALGEVGAAVNIAPNATRALIAIGLGEKIADVGLTSPGIYTRNMQTGEFLEFNDRRKTAARLGAPYYTFHRADLLDALASGLDRRLVHLDHRLVGIEERSDRVELTFANGAKVEAQFVIGADGVRSVIRQALYGQDNPTYTGQMVWRALLNSRDVPREQSLSRPGISSGRVLVVISRGRYYIRGEKLVAIVTQEDTAKWVEEGWSTPGDPDEMRLSFP